MATYLQGVTDYIPQFQPFQPDLNFYANVMQTKQSQYDTNWKALSKMYSQYYYADLTRDGNVKKKDQYLNNIEFQLKRVSQLDLSLEQNVNQATQVFKPFYEDKGLMKDMAWTKNYNNQLNRAEIFRNSTDEANRGQYWEEGVRGMNYLKDEFKNATDEEAMSFQNAEYVPNVDVLGKAEKIAKDSGLSIEKVDFSDGGKFIVKTKNGEALTEPLQKLFEARLGTDPAIQAKYKMQAYVDRKNYAYSNAAQFNGDKNAAEMKYLENSFNVLKAQSDVRYKQLQANSTVYDNSIKDIEDQIKNGTASPTAKLMLEQYKMNKDINDKVLARAEEESKMLNSGQSTSPLAKKEFVNPYGDLKSLRYKVDNGMASLLMQKDLDEAANIYAYRDMEVDVEANPYKILEEKQRNSMQLVSARLAASKDLAVFKNNLQKQKDYEDNIIENGAGYRDEKGNLHLYEDQNTVTTGTKTAGNVTDEVNLKDLSRQVSDMRKKEILDPYFQSTFVLLDKALDAGQITQQEISEILSFNKNKKISFKDFREKYAKYGDNWVRVNIGSKGIDQIRNKMNQWVAGKRENSYVQSNGQKTEEYKMYRMTNMKLNDYMLYLKDDEKFRKNSSKSVVTDLESQGYEYAKYLYDDNGNKRSEKQYINALLNSKSVSKDQIAEYIAQEKIKKGEAGYKAAVQLIGENDYWTQKGAQFLDVLDRVNKFLKPITAPKQYAAEKIYKAATTPSINFDYDDLVKAATKSYTNAKVVKDLPAGVMPKDPKDPGTGLFTIGPSETTVNPKAPGLSYAKWGEVVSDLKNFDWAGDIDRVSVNGITKDAYTKAGTDYATMGKNALDKILQDSKQKKSSLKMFRLEVDPIAAGSQKFGAVTVRPNAEWIKANTATTKTVDGKIVVTAPGLFMPDQAQAVLRNGITYFMDTKKMSNSMYKNAFLSPLESYVNRQHYVLNNIGGDPMKSFKVEKNTLGTGDYITTITYPLYDPNTGEMTLQRWRNNVGFMGENLEGFRDRMIYGFMDDIDFQNTLEHNNFQKISQ